MDVIQTFDAKFGRFLSDRHLLLQKEERFEIWRAEETTRVWKQNGTFEGGGVAASSDGRLVVIWSDDTAQVFDTSTAAAVGPPLDHDGADIECAVFSPRGDQLATGACDGLGRVWNVGIGTPACVLGDDLAEEGNYSPAILGLDWSPSGDLIVSFDRDGSGRVWSSKSGLQESENSHSHHREWEFARFLSNRTIVSCGDNEVCTWDARDGDSESGAQPVVGPDYAPLLLIADSLSADAKSIVATSESWRVYVVSTRGLGFGAVLKPDDEDGEVVSAALNQSGAMVATGSDCGNVIIWLAESEVETARAEVRGRVNSLSFSPNDSQILVSGEEVTLFDISQQGRIAQELDACGQGQ